MQQQGESWSQSRRYCGLIFILDSSNLTTYSANMYANDQWLINQVPLTTVHIIVNDMILTLIVSLLCVCNKITTKLQ